MLVLQDLADVSLANSVEALRTAAHRVSQKIEFERFALLFLGVDKVGASIASSIDNVPDAYRALYDDPGGAKGCPVMQHARQSSQPLVWGKDNYASAGMSGKWEQQSSFGYAAGIIVAAHLPDNQHVVVGVERSREVTGSSEEVTRILAAFQLFATFSIDVTLSLLAGKNRDQNPEVECPLTAREKESLSWTLAGKTAWEIGMLLSISERTAAQHLGACIAKLGTVNKHQAALKAARLGWISGY